MERHTYPDDLKTSEDSAVTERRTIAKIDSKESRIGIALSGGGIRSATFCLGVLQALAKHDFLKRIDFLSTISGGGYIGGFLGRLFTRQGADAVDEVSNVLKDTNSVEVNRLRENGRYLAPNGGGGGLIIAAIYLRNLIGLHFTMGLALLFAFLSLNLLRFEIIPGIWAHLHSWLQSGASEATRQGLDEANAGFGFIELMLVGKSAQTLWWSPWVILPALSLLLAAVPTGWAYWNTQFAMRMRSILRGIAILIANAIVIGAAIWVLCHRTAESAGVTFAPNTYAWIRFVGGGLVCLIGCVTLITWAVAVIGSLRRNPKKVGINSADLSRARTAEVRNVLSSWLSNALGMTIVFALVALIDTFGQSVYAMTRSDTEQPFFKLFVAVSGLSGLAAAVFKYKGALSFLTGGGGKDTKVTVSLRALAGCAGYFMMFVVLIFWSWAAHGITYAGGEPANGFPGRALVAQTFPKKAGVELNNDSLIKVNSGTSKNADASANKEPAAPKPASSVLWFAWTLLLGLSWCAGYCIDFLNLSALQNFYGSRLTRAYLGASNRLRSHDVTRTAGDDDIRFADYTPHTKGGPLHIIGTTLNETVSGKSQIVDQDRKGMVLAVGPSGITCGIEDHALWVKPPKSEESSAAPSKEKKDKKDNTPKPEPTKQTHPKTNALISVRPLAKSNQTGDSYHMFFPGTPDANSRHDVEALSLGNWVSVSGAAFSTGMGANTNTGLSLLLALFNIRLGFFWDSRIAPWKRTARTSAGLGPITRLSTTLWERLITYCPVHSHLFYESVARFHGPNRRLWYLSDGGHFENTGCYELIRRQVPFIICCDCGADPDYLMEDISNLVRKARIDFQAEIRFFTREELKKHVSDDLLGSIGTLSDLQRVAGDTTSKDSIDSDRLDGKPYSGTHATLAWVTYSGQATPGSCILFIKPTLTGDEPIDVKHYHASHADFPQETTLDQFFDEAQWESYRCLGQHIGDGLFQPRTDSKWSPAKGTKPA